MREKLADVLALVGRWTDALGHYEALRRELEAAGDNIGQARLYRKIGVLRWETGDRERAGASFASGLERIGEEGSSIERAELFQELGRLAFRAGDNAGAIAWAEQALLQAAKGDGNADAERSREVAATRAQAHNTLGVALARTGRLTDAADKIEQSIAIAQQHDLLQVACRGYASWRSL
jgi:adenylate cyclase